MNLYKKLDPSKLHIIPFGGCGEFGMNMTAYILAKKLYLVDAGILFPEHHQLGVASVIPAVDHLIRQFGGVATYLITHGHEDHIGALPHLYRNWPAPIYATPWTVALISRRFAEKGIVTKDIHTVKVGQTVRLPHMQVLYFHVNHSIPDAASLYITAKRDRVFHTGDFKVDPSPVGTSPVDLVALQKIGDAGVDLLIADSTNAHTEGPSPSESSVIEPLENLLREAKGRVFLTTFASNLWRLMCIVDICARLGKRLVISGRGMSTCLSLGQDQGKFRWPPGVLAEESTMSSIPDRQLVVLVSGSQAEPRSSLQRIAIGEHRHIKVKPGDNFIFSSRIIPGNEKNVFSLVDHLKRQGAKIITTREQPNIHVSGHAYADDLKKFITHLRPKHYLPVHGSFSHLQANASVSMQLPSHTQGHTLVEDGDVLQLSGKAVQVLGRVELGHAYIDRDSDSVMPWEVLRERLRIGELGMALLTGVFSRRKQAFISGPDLSFQGLVLPPGCPAEVWSKEVCQWIQEQVEAWIVFHPNDIGGLTEKARNLLRRQLLKTFHKKPVVLAKIYMV